MSDTKNGIANLFTIKKDDSPLKTAVVYGGAGLGIYYVLKLLRWDVNRTQAAQAQEQEVAKANTTVDSAASLAAKLGAAISSWGNTDERVIYDILWDKVASREFLQEIYKSYSVQFGRSLETDLYENLDNFLQPWKPDWNVVKKRLEYIKLVQRKIVNGTPQYIKLANPMPVNPKKP